MNDIKKEVRGGCRPGAGRPKKDPTKVLTYRVPIKMAKKINKAVKVLIKSLTEKPLSPTK